MQRQSGIPQRQYKDKVSLSIIGFGGIVLVGFEQREAGARVGSSIDAGVNYFDVAPSYRDGEAETKLGIALEPYRKSVFLACKTQACDAEGARADLERSLRRLKTDYFDLYQFHAVSSNDEVDQILARGGAGEFFFRARQEGKIRFLGASVHSEAAGLRLLDSYPLDSIMFPINFNAWARGGFGPRLLAAAKGKGIARLALKSLALGQYASDTARAQTKYSKCWYQPVPDPALAARALRFTLSQDVTAVIPPGDDRLYDFALSLASGFQPMDEEEQRALLAHPVSLEPVFSS